MSTRAFYALLGVFVFLVTAGIIVYAINRSQDRAADDTARTEIMEFEEREAATPAPPQTMGPDVLPDEVEVPPPRVIEKRVIERVPAAETGRPQGSFTSPLTRPDNQSSSETQARPSRETSQRTVPVRQKLALPTGGPEEPQTVVINTERDWEKLQQSLVGPSDTLAFDPARETAIGIFLGTRNTGGYGVKVTAIRETDRNIVVQYQEIKPGPNQGVTQALTSPGLLMTIPKTRKPVVFKKVTA